MLPVNTMSAPSIALSRRTSSTGSPARITLFCQSDSVIVELITYLVTRFS